MPHFFVDFIPSDVLRLAAMTLRFNRDLTRVVYWFGPQYSGDFWKMECH